MGSAFSALRGSAYRSCRDVVSVSVNMNGAGIAASDGGSDWAGGPAGDLAGASAGHGSDIGIGGRRGSIRYGAGPDTGTVTRQDMRPVILTTEIIPLPLRQKIIRAVTLSQRRLMKVTRNPLFVKQRSRCRCFCI